MALAAMTGWGSSGHRRVCCGSKGHDTVWASSGCDRVGMSGLGSSCNDKAEWQW